MNDLNNLPHLLTRIALKLDDLLLDPNNPRFSELAEELKSSRGPFCGRKGSGEYV